MVQSEAGMILQSVKMLTMHAQGPEFNPVTLHAKSGALITMLGSRDRRISGAC